MVGGVDEVGEAGVAVHTRNSQGGQPEQLQRRLRQLT